MLMSDKVDFKEGRKLKGKMQVLVFSSYMTESQGILYVVDGKENKHLNIFLKVTMVSNTGAENNHEWGGG